MINEERVKELFRLAVYDAGKDKVDEQLEQYFMWDYIGKELVKSFVTGTLAYLLLVVLWGMGELEQLSDRMAKLEFVDLAVRLGVVYIGFIAVYLFVTLLVYAVRYAMGRKRLHKLAGHVKKVRKMYQRDERLKA